MNFINNKNNNAILDTMWDPNDLFIQKKKTSVRVASEVSLQR